MDFSESVDENPVSAYLTDSTTYVVESGGASMHRTEALTCSDLP
jgi:hypothetical protein